MTLNIPELTQAVAVLRTAAPHALTPITSGAEYDQALSTLERLMKEIGDDTDHPLEPLAAALTEHVMAYEDRHYPLPQSSPARALAYCMELRGLTQTALAAATGIDQGILSKLLSGNRAFNTRQVRVLSEYFRVDPGLFL